MLLDDFEVKYSDHTLSSHCVCVGGLSQFWPSSTVWLLQAPLHPPVAQTFISTTTYRTSVSHYWETLKVHEHFSAADKVELFWILS